MDRNRVEEAFNGDHCLPVCRDRSVQVEEDQRLSEAGGKSILWLLAINCGAGVRDQFAGCVVNWDHDPSAKQTFPVYKPRQMCGRYACDLVAHAQAAALAEADDGRDPRDLPTPLVFFWTGEQTTCPRGGATLPAVA